MEPGFHIGFFIESREAIDRLNARLREDGYEEDLPGDIGHSYGFYITAPGEFTVEVEA